MKKEVAKLHRLQVRGGVYYYVRRVPTHLVPSIGKTVLKVSLGTKAYKEAVARRTLEDLKSDALFARAAGHSKIVKAQSSGDSTPNLSTSALLSYVRDAVEEYDAASRQAQEVDPPDDVEQVQELEIDAETFIQILKTPHDPRQHQAVSFFAKQVLTKAGASSEGVADWAAFQAILKRGLIELEQRKLDRYQHDFTRAYHDRLFAPAACVSPSFSELCHMFVSEQTEYFSINGISEKRADKLWAEIDLIKRIVGGDTPLNTIDDDVVQKVRSYIAQLPPNMWKHYPNLSLDEIISQAKKDGRHNLAWQTQKSYLAAFSNLLSLAVRKKHLGSNPASEIAPIKNQTLSAEERRESLSDKQLKELFQGEFYRKCALQAARPFEASKPPWRYWFPLLMLFTGARPNEIAQISTSDVRMTSAGTIYFDLTGSTKQLKTSASRRKIPLHKELRRLGFLDFVAERQKDQANTQLFSLKENRYGNLAWYPCKRFNEKFLPEATKLDDRQSLYSLRHNFRDALRRVDAPAGALLALAGWSPNGKAVSDHYGDPNNPDLYVDWIEAVEYPCLDLSFLHVQN